MTTYYVGTGGNNGNAGTSWALRKLTLNGAEDIPVAAGDTVYVGPGTYRELLTVDVSGSGGSPITYIGDYSGANTDGVGGVVRVTGSDDDQSGTRANCIIATSKDYRTFRGFVFEGTTNILVSLITSCSNWIIDQCYLHATANRCMQIGGTGTTNTTQNCMFLGYGNSNIIEFTHSSTVSNAAHVVQNSIFLGGSAAIVFTRVGGATVKNCLFISRAGGVQVGTALAGGQTETVNNCIFVGSNVALSATVLGEITENYNNIIGAVTARTNVATGANSLTYVSIFDVRWFFELVGGKGRMLSPFDLASYSQLINVAGTSPTTTDVRGTSVIGAQREFGALEYDPALLIRRVIARQV